ncbi:MAG: ATP-binding protein [Dermatophilaceae bacterium]
MTAAPTKWSVVDRAFQYALIPSAAITMTIGLAAYDQQLQQPHLWAGATAFGGVCTFAWAQGLFRPRRAIAIVAALVSIMVLVGMPFGFAPVDLARIAFVDAVVVLAILYGYRRASSTRDWFPDGCFHVGRLTCLVAVGTAVIVLAGGIPYVWWSDGASLSQSVLWFVRMAAHLMFGLLAMISLWFPPRPAYSRIEYRRYLPLIIPFGVACLLIPFLTPSYPLDWMVLIPAVWIGVTLTPRTVAWGVIAMSLIPTVFRDSPHWRAEPDQLLPASSVLELLLTTAIILSFVLVAFREQRARLTAKAAEAAANSVAQSELLNSVIQTMRDGVLLADSSGRVQLTNAAARAMLGRPTSRSSAVGWAGSYAFRTQGGSSLSDAQLNELLNPPADGFARLTVAVPGADGDRSRYVTLAARALVHRHDRLSLVLISDATTEHSRRRVLESFAGTVAHDLKSPLSALALWMDVAETELDDDIESGQHALEQARKASRRMSTIIDEYLNYTVTREGLLRPAPVELDRLVREVSSAYGHGEGAPTIDVTAEETVQADRALLGQLIGNLVGNAVKYARPGEPAYVRVSSAPDAEPGWVRVRVEDKGLGLCDEDSETIFEPFSRGAVGAANGQGIGLGLAVCHAIVRRHGGTINAHGNDWGGATFEFTLPRADALLDHSAASAQASR